MAVLILEEGGEGFVCLHASGVGLVATAADTRGREADSNDESGRVPPSQGGGICALLRLRHQQLPCEATKKMGEVMQAWDHRWYPHVVERLILELLITVVSPYYSTLLFILFSLVQVNGEG